MANDSLDPLDENLQRLEHSLSSVNAVSTGFERALDNMRHTFVATDRDTQKLSRSLSTNFKRATDSVLFGSSTISDAFERIRQSLVRTAYKTAMKPLESALHNGVIKTAGSFIQGVLPFKDGGAFMQGRILPFAKGGIVNSPTLFPMQQGTGLMGEAGAEAILPLGRDSGGRLGVRAMQTKQQPIHITMNIQTPDVAGFERSQSQIAAGLSRVLARGQRNQ